MTKMKPYELDDPKGYTDDEGNYVPTEQEIRDRWPDVGPERDLSVDGYRTKIWLRPLNRNLIPFHTREQAQKKQVGSVISRVSKIHKYKMDKEEKRAMLDIMKEELNSDDEDYDPYKMLQLRSRMAVLEEDWDKVEQLAVTMLEFTKPKLARVEQKNTNFDFGEASMEDMVAFTEGSITYEEFLKKQKG